MCIKDTHTQCDYTLVMCNKKKLFKAFKATERLKTSLVTNYGLKLAQILS